ncbi:hypothetical protein QFZ49_003704 [Streptomyces turgidiscabies]|uniref:Secreted protein n=1 Tax=Streptomyces turgidiscabies TaxID=85558 RepID=A0ABU0RP74_9ACTN|nr:hypothetical protein [Streptomyces turgidiscabies]
MCGCKLMIASTALGCLGLAKARSAERYPAIGPPGGRAASPARVRPGGCVGGDWTSELLRSVLVGFGWLGRCFQARE